MSEHPSRPDEGPLRRSHGLRLIAPPDGLAALATVDRHWADLETAFRPVADLRRGGTAGFEALVAPPDGEARAAADWSAHGLAPDAGAVEARILECALRERIRLAPRSLLAVTVSAEAAVTAPVQDVLAAAGPLERVVLSIVGGDAVETFALGAALEPARDNGLRIAVEAGPAGRPQLERLTRLRPELIVAGEELVHCVAEDLACSAAVEAIVALASRIDAEVLAVGVSREPDLRALARLGVRMAMGPRVGAPAAEMRALGASVEALVAALACDQPAERSLAGLIESPIALPVTTPMSDIVDALLLDPRNDFLPLVDEEYRPVALVERAAVLRAEPSERPVMWVMPDSLLKAVARRAVERPPLERFTPLVCCDAGGRYIGLVRVERLVSALAH